MMGRRRPLKGRYRGSLIGLLGSSDNRFLGVMAGLVAHVAILSGTNEYFEALVVINAVLILWRRSQRAWEHDSSEWP
jgi:hypothetical protein